MDENLEILKQQWQHLSARTDALEEANRRMAEKMARTKTSSLQDRLATRIIRMGWLGIILPALAPLLYFELSMPWWVSVLYGLFGVIMSVASFFMGEYVREYRMAEMPVAEAIERATKIKVNLGRVRLAGFVMGSVLVALMVYVLPEGPEREPIIIGGSVGLCIGLVIGIRRWLVNARLARELLRSLK